MFRTGFGAMAMRRQTGYKLDWAESSRADTLIPGRGGRTWPGSTEGERRRDWGYVCVCGGGDTRDLQKP